MSNESEEKSTKKSRRIDGDRYVLCEFHLHGVLLQHDQILPRFIRECTAFQLHTAEFQIEPGMIGMTLDEHLYVVVASWKIQWSLHHPPETVTYELFSYGAEESKLTSSDEIIL